jgi:hypothetical protein
MSTEVRWSRKARRTRDSLSERDQQDIQILEAKLQQNVHAGSLYFDTIPKTFAFVGMTWTLLYTKSHPADPAWIDVQDVVRSVQ